MAFIEVNNICKEFKILKNQPGMIGSIKSLFHREYNCKKAVKDISFSIDKGEMVGYIGPNGAGKSTTIKMLSGVLTPSSGSIFVNGIVPYENRKLNAKHIGVVFGQRSQLYWDLPVSDTFDLYQRLYEIEEETYRKNRDFYIQILKMEEFIDQPVRQLSLGQKMKANIALALLHNPKILYLDEPTIGLDVMSKRVLRDSVRQINRERQTTVILTTHDMDDIEQVCSRIILIDQGEKLFDGRLADFKSSYQDGFVIKLEFDDFPQWIDDGKFSLQEQSDNAWFIKSVQGMSTKEAMISLIDRYDPTNIFIQEQRIEDIIQKIFNR